MNKLTDKLQKIHEEWQQSTRLALAAVRDEQKAKSLAADKFSVQLMEMIPEIVQRMTSLYIQRVNFIEERDSLLCTKYCLEKHLDKFSEYLETLCQYCSKDGKCPIFYRCPAKGLLKSCGDMKKEDWIQATEEEEE